MSVRNLHPLWRIQVDFLLKGSIQESAFDVDLIEFQILVQGEDNQHAQRNKFARWGIGDIIISPFYLLKTPHAKSCLVFRGDIELIFLDFENLDS